MIKIINLFLCLFNFSIFLYSQKGFDINEYRAEENFKRGIYYYNETKYLSAIEFFIKALQYKPNFDLARIWLGNAYYRAGYIENAIFEFNTAIENGSTDNTMRNKLNNLLYRIGNPQKISLIQNYVYNRKIDGNRWDSRRFIQPISVYVDKELNIYVLSVETASLHIFDLNGNLIKKITGGKKSFKMPYSLAFDFNNNIIISDLKTDLVHKLRKDGKPILMFGGTGTEPGKFLGPEGIAVDNENNIYVVDSGNCRVQKFSPDGKFLLEFGSKGEENENFLKPSGISIDENGFIYVSDIALKKIKKFDKYGNFIETLFDDKNFYSPRNIHILKNYFLIADGRNGLFIYDFDSDNWLNILRYNYNNDKFLYVSDLFISPDSSLVVSDLYKNTIEIFIPESYKYSNLEVEIEHIDLSKYPKVALYVSAWTKDGTPVSSLKKENFTIKELNVPMMPFSLYEKIYNKNKILTIFLVEKSEQMKNFEEELKKAASFFLQDILKTEDLVKVVNFHTLTWAGSDYDYSQLRILESLTEDNYSKINDLSIPIYNSITELMNKLSRRALIFFTTGDFDVEKDFKKYPIEVCKNYARNNHVPIYIINFTDKNEKELKELAKSTYGEYYNYFKDIKKLKKIRDSIIKYPLNQYILIYETAWEKKFSNTWRQITVEANYNKLTGKATSGYFVP